MQNCLDLPDRPDLGPLFAQSKRYRVTDEDSGEVSAVFVLANGEAVSIPADCSLDRKIRQIR